MSETAINQLAAAQMSRDVSSAHKLGQTAKQNIRVEDALEVKDAFTAFVGETFYSQMIKAMRTSVGKPAYFHGGQAEEIFRGQLDQTLSEHMTRASASQFSEPMFELQFPELASALREHERNGSVNAAWDGLAQLGRR